MSAVAGVVRWDGRPLPKELLREMLSRLRHRGPDAEGSWNDDGAGLGQCMLWTTPESRSERLPFFDPRSMRVITSEARVDNRSELADLLGLRPAPGREWTDSELILAAYEAWGEDCARKVLGDFVFAVWDIRRKEIFLARDIFGVKHFYYFASRDFFAFASEIKALLCLPGVPKRLNEIRVADHLLWSAEDPEITFYEGILRLPPAHTMTVRSGSARKKRYWSPDASFELRLPSDEAYAERLKEIFTEAVRCRLRGVPPVGSLLSGGLDSSAIACTARRILLNEGRAPLRTFSAVFGEASECDESGYVAEVTSLEGIESHRIQADAIRPFHDMERLFWHLDEPHYVNLSMFWGGFYPEARSAGVRVLLDGDGGDEVVSRGYPRLAEMVSRGRWLELLKEAGALSKKIGKPLAEILWLKALRPFMPVWMHRTWRGIRWKGRPLWLDGTLLNPRFSERLRIRARAAEQLGHEMFSPRSVRQDDRRGLVAGGMTYGAEVLNRASAAYGVEHRYPFYDRRVVEFCLSLPSDQKLRHGWTRFVMRQAMRGILPERIRWRGGKIYMDSSIGYGLRKFEAELLEGLMLGDAKLVEPYVDIRALKKVYRAYLKRPTYESVTSVWHTAIFILWLKTGQAPAVGAP